VSYAAAEQVIQTLRGCERYGLDWVNHVSKPSSSDRRVKQIDGYASALVTISGGGQIILSEVPAAANVTETDRSCSQRDSADYLRQPTVVRPSFSAEDYNLNRETLHHQSDRTGNTVQVYPLRI
jgi:hypothetical protein